MFSCHCCYYLGVRVYVILVFVIIPISTETYNFETEQDFRMKSFDNVYMMRIEFSFLFAKISRKDDFELLLYRLYVSGNLSISRLHESYMDSFGMNCVFGS